MIEVRTLTDGGQRAGDVAGWIAAFMGSATRSLDIALYDLAISGETEDAVVGAIRAAAQRGVSVRLLYNVDHANPVPVPPPPSTDADLVARCGVPVKAVPGVPDLMHHKYVVKDRDAVWTGSTNWTDDSWSREENIVVIVDSPGIAEEYTHDFEELWSTQRVTGSGSVEPHPVKVDGTAVTAWFCPEKGRRLSHHIAGVMGRASRRIRIGSPVLTSGPILGTLAEVAAAGKVDLSGALDATQMREVLGQWRADGHAEWKIPAYLSIVRRAPFSGKVSTPYGPGTVHDYMHAKIVVADDVVFTGSYNLSHSGEENAENVLEIESGELADRLASYVDGVRGRYPPIPTEEPPGKPQAAAPPGRVSGAAPGK